MFLVGLLRFNLYTMEFIHFVYDLSLDKYISCNHHPSQDIKHFYQQPPNFLCASSQSVPEPHRSPQAITDFDLLSVIITFAFSRITHK